MSLHRRSCTEQTKSYTFSSDDDDDDEERSQASGGQSFVAKPRRQSGSSFEFDEEEDSEEERPTSRRPRSCRRDLDISFGSAVSVEPPSSGPSRPRAPPRPVAPPAPRSTPPSANSEEERPAKRRRPSKKKSADGPVRPPSSGPPRPRPRPRPAAPPAPTSTPPPADSCPVCEKKTVNKDGSLQDVVQCSICATKVHFKCSSLRIRQDKRYLCPLCDSSQPWTRRTARARRAHHLLP